MKKIVWFFMLPLLVPLPLRAYVDEYAGPGIIKEDNRVVGLITLESAQTKGLGGCTQIGGRITVEGLQFSKSGNTLESFYFVDSKGDNMSVPTGFDLIKNLSNYELSIVNNFIKKDKDYIIRIQLCGSGGYTSLIDIYDPMYINKKI